MVSGFLQEELNKKTKTTPTTNKRWQFAKAVFNKKKRKDISRFPFL